MSFHVRRKDKEIRDKKVIKKILKTCSYITVAFSNGKQPYLTSLNYGYDESQNCIFFHCAGEGKKLEYIRSNGTVWGQALIDHGYAQGKCTHLYASVHFSGKTKLLVGVEEKLEAMKCMISHLDNNPKKLIKSLKPEKLKNITIGRIDIEYITGKKSKEVVI